MLNRRHFIMGGPTVAAASLLRTGSTTQANERRIRVAVIGCGNQGGSHIRSLGTLANVEIAYLCDVDSQRLAKAVSQVGGAQGVSDLRKVLDDSSVDAVTIATPDHWHAPAALLALEAGKHVYVEKPWAHNVRESQMLLKAARRQDRVVAHGTQSRSSPGIQSAIHMLHEGVIGEVLTARCWNWQLRKNIGHAAPSQPPPDVDYDTWVGPAEMLPFQANRFHYDWHWWYNFGCGDLGNDGIHELDLALWGLGVDTHPATVTAGGGKYYFDDDQQFPDTQQIIFEYPGDGRVGSRKMLVYEQRLWSTNYPFNVDSGVEFHGAEGRMLLSKRGKFEVLGQRNARLDLAPKADVKVSVMENQQNWINCILSGGSPHANINTAHRAVLAVHLGNIATRLGRTLRFDPAGERLLGDEEASQMLGRAYRRGGHWSVPKELG
jgi:predicted dehydrogenase